MEPMLIRDVVCKQIQKPILVPPSEFCDSEELMAVFIVGLVSLLRK